MSEPPNPPSRNDPKYRLRPSLEIAGPFSLRTELIPGPRLTGVDHPENFGDPATGLDTANNANATPIQDVRFQTAPSCHAASGSSHLSATPPRSFWLVGPVLPGLPITRKTEVPSTMLRRISSLRGQQQCTACVPSTSLSSSNCTLQRQC